VGALFFFFKFPFVWNIGHHPWGQYYIVFTSIALNNAKTLSIFVSFNEDFEKFDNEKGASVANARKGIPCRKTHTSTDNSLFLFRENIKKK
jgi:hypothetical protein